MGRCARSEGAGRGLARDQARRRPRLVFAARAVMESRPDGLASGAL